MTSQPETSEETALAARLRAALPDLTRSEAKIAQWLLLNEGSVARETGASIAAKTRVSEITVSRFLRRLGFRGIAALKEEAQSASMQLGPNDVTRYLRLLGGELGTVLRQDADAVLGLASQIGRAEWTDAIGLIDQADEVFVTGFQTIRGLAEDFSRRLSIVRGSVRYLSAHDTGLAEWLPSVRRGHETRCLILIDIVPYAREGIVMVRRARKLGMTVVVVTDELNHWAAEHTPYVFHAATKVGSYLESTGPLATLLNLVTHAVAGRDPAKARKRLADWPVMLRELDLY